MYLNVRKKDLIKGVILELMKKFSGTEKKKKEMKTVQLFTVHI